MEAYIGVSFRSPRVPLSLRVPTSRSSCAPVEILERADYSLGGLILGGHAKPLPGVPLSSFCSPAAAPRQKQERKRRRRRDRRTTKNERKKCTDYVYRLYIYMYASKNARGYSRFKCTRHRCFTDSAAVAHTKQGEWYIPIHNRSGSPFLCC